MENPEIKCSNCGHEKTEWLPFHEINGKSYCEMCLTLALDCQEHYNGLKKEGFQIITAGGIPEDVQIATKERKEELWGPPPGKEVKCAFCEQPASKELPIYMIKEHGFCVVCLGIAIKEFAGKLAKEIKFGKWWERRQN